MLQVSGHRKEAENLDPNEEKLANLTFFFLAGLLPKVCSLELKDDLQMKVQEKSITQLCTFPNGLP